jgi:predicted RNase H-like nuclease (RuvC/YqgF family)
MPRGPSAVRLETTSTSEGGRSRLRKLKRFERGIHMLIKNNMAALRRTLEDAGVEFIARTKTKGPGVRLKE